MSTDVARDWDETDALKALWDRSAYDKGFVTNPFAGDAEAGLGLLRTAAVLNRLGSPQNAYPIIHVAGSKGKSSTSAIAAAILQAAGARVGLHTSPHLHDFRERFIVDGRMIDPEAFAALTQRVLAAAEGIERDQPQFGRATAFEIATVMALEHFRETRCSAAVIEVGMGGTLDATNVVEPAVSVITTLDFEHVAVLGPGMADIAANKAGIIKAGRPAVSVRQPPAAETVILAAAVRAGTSVFLQDRDWRVDGAWRDFTASGPWGSFGHLRSNLAGNHQMQNAGAAIAALWAARDQLPAFSDAAIRTGLAAVQWAGRYERVESPGGALIVLDGAHTPASATALAATVRAEKRTGPLVVIVGMFADKAPASFLAALMGAGAGTIEVIAAPAPSPRTTEPAALAAAASALGMRASVAASVAEAIEIASARTGVDGLVLVTGSLSVVAAARDALDLDRIDSRTR